MTNITMSVDDTLLKKARKAAIERDVSLSELFRRFLKELVEREEAKRAIVAEELDNLFEESTASSEGRRWTREELHER
jgi:metal-responsive CopG/Arc/MetJ family transcriptional regulator